MESPYTWGPIIYYAEAYGFDIIQRLWFIYYDSWNYNEGNMPGIIWMFMAAKSIFSLIEVPWGSISIITWSHAEVKFWGHLGSNFLNNKFQLNSIGWNGSNKMSVCPGIVELTQRFNRISFWVISVILQKQTNKIRSEVVQQFIKIAKRLHDLRKMLKISPRKIFLAATYAIFLNHA